MTELRTGRQAIRSLGVFAIVGYCLLLLAQLPWALPLPEKLFIGPFLIGGVAVPGVVVGTAIALLAIVVGLLVRRSWGRWLAIAAFGGHAALMLLAIIVFVVDPTGAAEAYRRYAGPGNYLVDGRAALRIFIPPLVAVLVPSLLATAYLWDRPEVFRKEAAHP